MNKNRIVFLQNVVSVSWQTVRQVCFSPPIPICTCFLPPIPILHVPGTCRVGQPGLKYVSILPSLHASTVMTSVHHARLPTLYLHLSMTFALYNFSFLNGIFPPSSLPFLHQSISSETPEGSKIKILYYQSLKNVLGQ